MRLLFISSERGLCGAFNERLIEYGLAHARALTGTGESVGYVCLGDRGRRLLQTSGSPLLCLSRPVTRGE